MQFLFFTIFLILFNYSILAAESLIVKASSQYGTNQSQDQGCLQAKNEVMKEARRKIGAGETLSGDSLKICKASNDYAKCEMFTNSFHSLGKVAILGFDQIGGCKFSALGNNIFEATVEAKIIVKKLKEVSDNFDFIYSINKDQFISFPVDHKKVKTNEEMTMIIEPMEDMHVTIFQWWPYEDEDSVQRVFPNEHDVNNFFPASQKNHVPTEYKLQKYRFRNDFPKHVMHPDVQEFLMFIGTQKKVNFLKEYDYDEIGAKIFDISESKENKIRKHLISYIIMNRLKKQ